MSLLVCTVRLNMTVCVCAKNIIRLIRFLNHIYDVLRSY